MELVTILILLIGLLLTIFYSLLKSASDADDYIEKFLNEKEN